VAALLQPIESYDGSRLVVVQVAEPSQHRQVFAKRMLRDTLLRQAALMAVLLLVFRVVSKLALRPLDALALRLAQRSEHDLSPVSLPRTPVELASLVDGFNGVLARLRHAQEQQRRFVADASHQLRTPLTVLQLQADAGLKGDLPPAEALEAIASTTQRATRLAEQLLSLARAQQARSGNEPLEAIDLRDVAGEAVVELSPLIARGGLDFDFDCPSCMVHSHRWMVREILVNLLKNAIEFTPRGGRLGVEVRTGAAAVDVVVWDTGPGLSEAMLEHVFKPFATDRPTRGAGLGLAICQDLAHAAGASLELVNRTRDGAQGLQARVRFGRET
jgi:two-component system sensor histidine kinase TctE